MSDIVIKVENLSKRYRLGLINHGMLSKDLQSWWARFRGKEDPNARISLGEHTDSPSQDEIFALKDINFEVRQGEVLGIIGANGAGKSTLLKILSRVTAPTTGLIKIKGRIASLLEVGTGFHPELTGRENIYLNGAILGMRRWEIDKKLDEIIDFSGVEKFIDTPVKRYSSGMYVRLAFAVAAHLDPEILVVDEVLAVGDAEFQKKCLGKMDDVSKKEGRTVLFVSHNMAAVRQLCDSGILLKGGRVDLVGSAESAIDMYCNNIIIFKNKIKSGLSNRFYFRNIFINNSENNKVDKIVSGESVEFVLEYSSAISLSKVELSLAVFSILGIKIFSLNSSLINTFFNIRAESGFFVFEIPKINLNEGRYYLSAAAKINEERLDFVDNWSFDVIDNGCYRSGRKPMKDNLLLMDFGVSKIKEVAKKGVE